MRINIDRLLLEIARCPNVPICLEDADSNLDCVNVVSSQNIVDITMYQVPEPWTGRISESPLLFLSSNPSISETEAYPKWGHRDEEIIDFFNNRFGGGNRLWIKDGIKALKQDGEYAKWTPFWASIRQRSIELYQREVTPGIDYAITEVIHCKSLNEKVAYGALGECTDRYLARVVPISAAKVMVILGDPAYEGFTNRFSITPISSRHGSLDFNDRTMIVAFLPHPNARKKRTFIDLFEPAELSEIRAHLFGNEKKS